ncbi:MAG: riboflavin synthase [Gemmatimonadales bacterium]
MMFTGIVCAVGRVVEIDRGDGFLRLAIAAPFEDMVVGESVAVDGACLTVVGSNGGEFQVEAVTTTRGRTKFGSYSVGTAVNLERALAVGDRLGGHFVQGHVDGVGTVTGLRDSEDARLLDVELPSEVADLAIPHGSITLDGVSLTVNEILSQTVVQVSLIPFTLDHTTLGDLEPGALVHVEGDVLGKYVKRLVRN